MDQRRGAPGWNSNWSRAQCHIAVLLSATVILTHTVLCDLMAPTSALSPLLAHARVIVQGIAKDTAKEATEDAVQQLKSIVFAITSAGRHHRNLTADEQTAVWELVCLLWVGSCCDSEPTTATFKLSYCIAKQLLVHLIALSDWTTAGPARGYCKLVAGWQRHLAETIRGCREFSSLTYLQLLIAEHLC